MYGKDFNFGYTQIYFRKNSKIFDHNHDHALTHKKQWVT